MASRGVDRGTAELNALQKLPSPTQDEAEVSSEDERMSDSEPEKDATEEELEKLVFGDNAGFREEIQTFGHRNYSGHKESSEEPGHKHINALTTINDEDLFFLDSQPGQINEGTLAAPYGGEDEYVASRGRGPPVWEDSDDEKMSISLMAVPRLRKLRHFEGEDVITGRDYVRRLRRQFEVLNPAPEWAKWSPQSKKPKKRRRDSDAADSSSDEQLASEDEMGDDSNLSTLPLAMLLRSTEALTRFSQTLHNKRIKFRPEVLAIERMRDIGPTQPSAITSLALHPALPLLLSSGLSSTLYLHHFNPHPTPPDPPNPVITSLHLKHTPLTTTSFSPPSSSAEEPQIYLSSRRRYFHIWNLPTGKIRKVTRVYGQQDSQRTMETLKPSPCGRYVAMLGSSRKGGGVVNVLNAGTLQWFAQARIESRKGVADFVWWADGRGICIVGRGGEVSEWDVEQKRIVARWEDEGAVGTTTMAIGGHASNSTRKGVLPVLGPDRWIAIGSTSGIVNIYERSAWSSSGGVPPSRPTPTKTLDHLTTPISHLAFSPCGQILAMSSRWKKDALRLVHLPSCTVYRNWPTSKTPLGRISAVALGEYSNGEGMGGRDVERTLVLCVGNEAGILRAWEITG